MIRLFYSYEADVCIETGSYEFRSLEVFNVDDGNTYTKIIEVFSSIINSKYYCWDDSNKLNSDLLSEEEELTLLNYIYT